MKLLYSVKNEDIHKLETLLPVPFFIINPDEIVYTNPLFIELTGYSINDLNSDPIMQLTDEGSFNLLFAQVDACLSGVATSCKGELSLKTKDDQILWLHYTLSPIEFDGKKHVLAIIHDITEKKEAKKHLATLVRLRDSMLAITQSVIGVVNLDYFYHLVLEKAITEIEAAEVGSILLFENSKLKIVAHQGFKDELISNFELPLQESFIYKATSGKLDRIVIIDDITKLDDVYVIPLEEDRSKMIITSIIAPIYIDQKFYGCISLEATEGGVFTTDDTKIMQFIQNNVQIAITNFLLQKEKHFLSQFDSLTKLYNRSFFEKSFETTLEKSKRYKEEFLLVIFDLNDLKLINDIHGHQAGDQIITHFADSLKTISRKSDLLARYGGDEFIAIFFYTDEQSIRAKIEKLLLYMQQHPIHFEGYDHMCSFSYGMVSFPNEGSNLYQLVKLADQRMYEYKSQYKKEH